MMSPKSKRSLRHKDSLIIADKICRMIDSSGLDDQVRQTYLKRLSGIDADKLEQAFAFSSNTLTVLDMKYIICFYIDMAVAHISVLFNIDPASVYTVRYRIRKKLRNNGLLDILI